MSKFRDNLRPFIVTLIVIIAIPVYIFGSVRFSKMELNNNLSALAKHFTTGKFVDYQNDLDVDSVDDIYFERVFPRTIKIYFGNLSLPFNMLLDDGNLHEFTSALGKCGITFEGDSYENYVFYYQGKRIYSSDSTLEDLEE